MAPGIGLVLRGGTGIVEKLRTFPLDVLILHRKGTTFNYEKSKSFVEEDGLSGNRDVLAHCLAGT